MRGSRRSGRCRRWRSAARHRPAARRPACRRGRRPPSRRRRRPRSGSRDGAWNRGDTGSSAQQHRPARGSWDSGGQLPGDSAASSSSRRQASASAAPARSPGRDRRRRSALSHDGADARADAQVMCDLAPARTVVAQRAQVGQAHAGGIGPGQQADRAAQPVVGGERLQLVGWVSMPLPRGDRPRGPGPRRWAASPARCPASSVRAGLAPGWRSAVPATRISSVPIRIAMRVERAIAEHS